MVPLSLTQDYKYEQLLRLNTVYNDVETRDGYKDFYARIKKARDEIRTELLHGTVDKFGNSRDNEKRAVLIALERILSFPHVVHRTFNDLHEKKREQEEKLKRKTGIHGQDVLNM